MKQQTIPFEFLHRKGLIAALSLPKGDGVHPHVAKSVLKHIWEAGRGCYKSHERIAEELGLSRRQVIRAIDKLLGLKVIFVNNNPEVLALKRKTKTYTVDWGEIELLVSKQASPHLCVTNLKSPVTFFETAVTNQQLPVTNRTENHADLSHNKPLIPETSLIPDDSIIEDEGERKVKEVLQEFGVHDHLLDDTALAVRSLTNPSGEPRCLADVKRLIDFARKNRIGPGLVRLYCTGKKPWPADAEFKPEAEAIAAKVDLERIRKKVRSIEEDVVKQGRKAGAPDSIIELEVKRILGLHGLSDYQKWRAPKRAEMETVS